MCMKRMKITLLTTLFIGILTNAVSQSASNMELPKVMPPSPEVAAIGKYGDMPMGYATGTPVIDIPIYTLKVKDIQVPVSLSYNASGIRVEEVATWVGLGWNLNTGGSLTRTVRGRLPDDYSPYGYMYTPYNIIYMNQIITPCAPYAQDPTATIPPELGDTCTQSVILKDKWENDQIDIEPDLFAFSVGGYSGKFTWNQQTSSFEQFPYSNILINYTTNSSGNITSFTLTLPNGSKAYFGISKDGYRNSREYTGTNNITTYFDGNASQANNSGLTSTSAWSLLTLEHPVGQTIEFNYTTVQAKNFGRMSEVSVMGSMTGSSGGGQSCAPYTGFDLRASFYDQNIYKPVLTSITSPSATVTFTTASGIRADVAMNERALEQITVSDHLTNTVKRYDFNYDYTTSPDSTILWGLTGYKDIAKKRLRLLRIQEFDTSGNYSLPPYKFTYSAKELPNRLSASQDYWGYYNGKTQYNDFLTPKVEQTCINTLSTGQPGTYVNGTTGADRTVDTSLSYSGILEKIEYPTGGFTHYFYESNLAPLIADAINPCVERSGLTEKKVEFGTISDTPTYYYSQNFTVGSRRYGTVTMVSQLDGCLLNNNSNCNLSITLRGVTNPSYINTFSMSGIQYLSLNEGEYKISATINPNTPSDSLPNFLVKLTWKEQEDPYNFPVGGLRVKKIISEDNLGNKIKRSFDYNLFNSPDASSGFLMGNPTHVINYAGGGFMTKVISNSYVPLNGEGRTIMYSNVTEYFDDDKSSFKNQYTFNVDEDQYMEGYRELTVKKTWRDGFLKKKTAWEKTGINQYRVLTEEVNDYAASSPHDYHNAISYLQENVGYHCIKMQVLNQDCWFHSEWFLPDFTTSKTYSYDASGNATELSSTVTNEYNSKHLLSATTTNNTKGQEVINKIFYPTDYVNNNNHNLPALISKHLMQLPVKTQTLVDTKQVDGSIILYNANGQPTNVFKYENNALVVPAAHDAANVLLNDYNVKHTIDYNASGDIVQLQKANDLKEVYIYGYNGQYPVAKVVGSDYATVYGLITPSIRGNLDNAVATPTSDDAVRTAINAIRSYLPTALVTTYTYKPLVGVTSETDPQGRVTYYEYDDFNRLKLIKDKDGNILKTFQYTYQEQQN